jgi:glycosyltransferase involved in cell wall biosynthesis
VLFVGRLAAQKRPLDLPAIAQRLPPPPQLVIVGDGPRRDLLEAQISRTPAHDPNPPDLNDRELAARLTAAARRYAFAHHSWPVLAQRVQRLYADLASASWHAF